MLTIFDCIYYEDGHQSFTSPWDLTFNLAPLTETARNGYIINLTRSCVLSTIGRDPPGLCSKLVV